MEWRGIVVRPVEVGDSVIEAPLVVGTLAHVKNPVLVVMPIIQEFLDILIWIAPLRLDARSWEAHDYNPTWANVGQVDINTQGFICEPAARSTH